MHTRARLRPTKALFVLAFVLAGLALGGGKAMADSGHVGAVYVATNTPANGVQVFYRSAQGQLTTGPVVATGGSGSLVNPPFGLAVTDSNYSVLLTQDNRVLLVTNNASGTISTFRVQPDGNIVLADIASSHGGSRTAWPRRTPETVGRWSTS